MSAGYAITATDINNRVGGLVTALWDNLEEINHFYRWLSDSTHDNPFLQGIGITDVNDQTLLRTAIGDLGNTTNGLWAVAHGLFAPAGANNYFFTAKKVTGTNWAG